MLQVCMSEIWKCYGSRRVPLTLVVRPKFPSNHVHVSTFWLKIGLISFIEEAFNFAVYFLRLTSWMS